MNDNISQLLETIKGFTESRGFVTKQSIGLLDPRFGYPFSPSATHHIIDDIVCKNPLPQPVMKFSVIPDRSLRMYDIDKIGISNRHLSFFETIAFGYVGNSQQLPKEQACIEVFDLMLHLGIKPENLLVTCLKDVKAEGTEIDNKEDEIFFKTWSKLLGKERVKLTSGRRNLFYSRVIGNPGGTGCEIYHRIGDSYVEIGSQVNYKFKFTGGLERTSNAAVPEGFGLERLLMPLEGVKKVSDVSTVLPLKKCVRDYLRAKGEDDLTIDLYDESLTKIADSIRAISFIIMDTNGNIDSLTSSQSKLLRDFRKTLCSEKSEINYLGIYDSSIYRTLVDTSLATYNSRYPDMINHRQAVLDFITP